MSSPTSPTGSQHEDSHSPGQSTVNLVAPSKWKGKGKEVLPRNVDHYSSDEQVDLGDIQENEERDTPQGTYPPTNEEELEERRVAENLKQWELAEKQRRKAARESRTDEMVPGSVIESVGRRVSLVFSSTAAGRIPAAAKGKRKSTSSQQYLAEDDEDAVRLDTRASMSSPPGQSLRPSVDTTRNPFDTPRSGSPEGPLMEGASVPPTPIDTKGDEPPKPVPQRSLSSIPAPRSRGPHPPRPLDLPEAVGAPPGPIEPPIRDRRQRNRGEEMDADEIAEKERWWTDWLCGCRQGGRGGPGRDGQAGRTNPFE